MPIPATTANTVRQPACCPSSEHPGRALLPVENSATTRPRTATGKGPVTVGETTDQNRAWVRR